MAFLPSREEQLTEDQLKWGYWWVTHKLQLKNILAAVIGVVAAVLVIYAAYGFADWYFGSGVLERFQIGQMANQPTGYPEIRQRTAAQPLGLDTPTVLVSGSNSYDISVPLTNPNAGWWAVLNWHFVVGGQKTGPTQTSVVLPNGMIYLVQLGFKSDTFPTGAELVVDNLYWRRLDQHQIRPDYPSWAGERLDFQVTDAEFKPPAFNDTLQVSRATFNIHNNTGYGYRRVGFFVVLWDGSTMVGVNHGTVGNLLAGETRSVDASWFTVLPRVTRVEVTPDINILDDGIYLPVK